MRVIFLKLIKKNHYLDTVFMILQSCYNYHCLNICALIMICKKKSIDNTDRHKIDIYIIDKYAKLINSLITLVNVVIAYPVRLGLTNIIVSLHY